MNARSFSDALGNIHEKYILEALQYKPVSVRIKVLKYASVAACVCLLIGTIVLFNHLPTSVPPIVTSPTESDVPTNPGELPPMLYVNDTLYKAYRYGPLEDLVAVKRNWKYLGVIEESVPRNTIPSENFQINVELKGAPIYQYGDGIIVIRGDQYDLYCPLKRNK